jgi:hypothetical protein
MSEVGHCLVLNYIDKNGDNDRPFDFSLVCARDPLRTGDGGPRTERRQSPHQVPQSPSQQFRSHIRPVITLRYALLCRATQDASQIRGLGNVSPPKEGLLALI